MNNIIIPIVDFGSCCEVSIRNCEMWNKMAVNVFDHEDLRMEVINVCWWLLLLWEPKMNHPGSLKFFTQTRSQFKECMWVSAAHREIVCGSPAASLFHHPPETHLIKAPFSNEQLMTLCNSCVLLSALNAIYYPPGLEVRKWDPPLSWATHVGLTLVHCTSSTLSLLGCLMTDQDTFISFDQLNRKGGAVSGTLQTVEETNVTWQKQSDFPW